VKNALALWRSKSSVCPLWLRVLCRRSLRQDMRRLLPIFRSLPRRLWRSRRRCQNRKSRQRNASRALSHCRHFQRVMFFEGPFASSKSPARRIWTGPNPHLIQVACALFRGPRLPWPVRQLQHPIVEVTAQLPLPRTPSTLVHSSYHRVILRLACLLSSVTQLL